MRVVSRPIEDGGIKIRKIRQQLDEVVPVVSQIVRRRARNANLVFPSVLEPVSFVPNLREEPQSVFRGGRPVFNHLRELVDFRGNERHGGREDGIELAEVGEVSGEVEREGIEGVRVLCEERERVGGCGISHGRDCGFAKAQGIFVSVNYCSFWSYGSREATGIKFVPDCRVAT